MDVGFQYFVLRSTQGADRPQKCPVCGKIQPDASRLFTHVLNGHPDEYRYAYERYTSEVVPEIVNLFQIFRFEQKRRQLYLIYKCTECSETNVDVRVISRHFRKEHAQVFNTKYQGFTEDLGAADHHQ